MKVSTNIIISALVFLVVFAAMIAIPYKSMSSAALPNFDEDADERSDVYNPLRSGRITDGALVYEANGCATCHTQVIRPTNAGADMWRSDWAGLVNDEDRGDTRRETHSFDYLGQERANIGFMRVGPDLSNVALRVIDYIKDTDLTPEMYLYLQLYNARAKVGAEESNCPTNPYLFDKVKRYGAVPQNALPIEDEEFIFVPNEKAQALVSYLLSLKKDDVAPAAVQ